jgi:hypothetical protein
MGLFSFIGDAVKGVGKALGKGLGLVGKAAGVIPGVGSLVGGAAGALGKMLEGASLKTALKTGAGDALGALVPGGSLIGDLLKKVPGVGSLVSKVPDLIPALGSALGKLDGQPGFGLGDLLSGAAGVAGTIGSIKAGNARNKLLESQANLANELATESKPLRTAAQAALLQRIQAGPRPIPSLAGVMDTANPFRKNFGAIPPPAPRPVLPAPTGPAPSPLNSTQKTTVPGQGLPTLSEFLHAINAPPPAASKPGTPKPLPPSFRNLVLASVAPSLPR